MNIVYILHFMLVMTIPFVGGCFLYSELKWNKFHDKAIGYGCLWALVVAMLLIADNQLRLFGRAVDAIENSNCQTLAYVAPKSIAKEVLLLDVEYAKKNGIEVVASKQEERFMCNNVWNVIAYRPNKKELSTSPNLQKVIERKELLVLKSANQ